MKAVTEVCNIKILKKLGGKKYRFLSQVIWAENTAVVGAGSVLKVSYYFPFRFKCEEHNMKERT